MFLIACIPKQSESPRSLTVQVNSPEQVPGQTLGETLTFVSSYSTPRYILLTSPLGPGEAKAGLGELPRMGQCLGQALSWICHPKPGPYPPCFSPHCSQKHQNSRWQKSNFVSNSDLLGSNFQPQQPKRPSGMVSLTTGTAESVGLGSPTSHLCTGACSSFPTWLQALFHPCIHWHTGGCGVMSTYQPCLSPGEGGRSWDSDPRWPPRNVQGLALPQSL
jgi:hypothetical protein